MQNDENATNIFAICIQIKEYQIFLRKKVITNLHQEANKLGQTTEN